MKLKRAPSHDNASSTFWKADLRSASWRPHLQKAHVTALADIRYSALWKALHNADLLSSRWLTRLRLKDTAGCIAIACSNKRQEPLIHGRACGAYHARNARRWVSCLSRLANANSLALLTFPALQCAYPCRSTSENLARTLLRFLRNLRNRAMVSTASLAIRAVRRISLCHRAANCRTSNSFHAGCVSSLDARKRIALCSRNRAQEPD